MLGWERSRALPTTSRCRRERILGWCKTGYQAVSIHLFGRHIFHYLQRGKIFRQPRGVRSC